MGTSILSWYLIPDLIHSFDVSNLTDMELTISKLASSKLTYQLGKF